MSQDVMEKIFEDRKKVAHDNLVSARKAFIQAQVEYEKSKNELLLWRNSNEKRL